MRWDSPIVLAFSGTLAIHTIVAVAADALIVTHPREPDPPPPPRIGMINVTVEPEPPPPPPPPQKAPEDPRPQTQPTQVAPRRQVHVEQHQPAPTTPETPVIAPLTPDPGGGQVIAIDGIAPSATGIAVQSGSTPSGHLARGGSGAGTGAGSGAGEPTPMSVATIKTRALPRGDYGYFDAGRDYPQEAIQLDIEGALRVRLLVDDHGKVTSATLLNHLGHGLDELALTRARKIEFEPARDSDDHAVASVVVWTFQMTPPK